MSAEFLTGTHTLADGRQVKFREVTGGTLAKFNRTNDSLLGMSHYVADCVLEVESVEPEDAVAFVNSLDVYDFTMLLKSIRTLSYSNVLDEAELQCAPNSQHSIVVTFKPLIDLDTLQTRPPDPAYLKQKHKGIGEVEVRSLTWGMLVGFGDNATMDVVFLARVISVDGRPFVGMSTLNGRAVRFIKRQFEALDGDAGTEVVAHCPECGIAYELDLLTSKALAMDFFGLV